MIKYPNGKRLVIALEGSEYDYTPYFADDSGNLYVSYANGEADATVESSFVHEIFEADEWQPKREDGVYLTGQNRFFATTAIAIKSGVMYWLSGAPVLNVESIEVIRRLSDIPEEFEVRS